VTVHAQPQALSGQRAWWIRVLLVLQAPRPVFVALRDDSRDAASDRAEPVLLVCLVAGMAGVLLTPTAATLMDTRSVDPLLAAIWVFLFGGLYGTFVYWAFGGVLHGAVKALGSQGSFRRTRHVLAFAAVPVALSLALWVVKIGVFGGDVFRTGGADAGGGGRAFEALEYAFVAWAAVLLVVGVRSVHGWAWGRAAGSVALAVAVPALLALALRSV
jgi:hypothetical protein